MNLQRDDTFGAERLEDLVVAERLSDSRSRLPVRRRRARRHRISTRESELIVGSSAERTQASNVSEFGSRTYHFARALVSM